MPKGLLLQFLENVSWRVLEDYSLVAKALTRHKPGVYALYRKGKLYYVGLASSLQGRLKTHLRDRHHGRWDRFSVYLTATDEHIKELESLLLRIVDPVGNRLGGRLRRAVNLRPILNKRIKDQDDDRRALLLGGSVAQRRIRLKTRRGSGTVALAGLVERRLSLVGHYRGKRYRASLRRDGRISYGKRLYDSPGAAANAARGRPTNGWSFWRYRTSDGNWVKLRRLKQ
jgi:hypothetical protein